MHIPLYQIDAFTQRIFSGNPAAVCLLEAWLDDRVMQAIASENNLSETAFIVPRDGHYEIRWFSPLLEIDLCGHATLASAFAVFTFLDSSLTQVKFLSPRSGELFVSKEGELLAMDFPAHAPVPCDMPDILGKGLGEKPLEVLQSVDYLAVFPNEDVVQSLSPDHEILKQLDLRGIIVTAPGKTADFVSRFFAPKVGINEDPVTGSAHCTLVPYWKTRLNKTVFHAKQLSRRGGELSCKDQGERVIIAGSAVCFLEGSITV